MRIVSLLPSATDMVAELGLLDQLVGRTHECDWPLGVESVPVMTRDALDTASMSTREINDAIGAAKHSGSSIYVLDVEALREARPDLILTQELCEVCAVSYSQVSHAARMLDTGPKLLSLEPTSLDDILDHIFLVAKLAGVPERAEAVVRRIGRRLQSIKDEVRRLARPRVASLEWLDPLFCAGHWVPEQVYFAGGNEVVGAEGEHSRRIEWSQVTDAEPEVLLLMPCGHSIDRARQDVSLVSSRAGWADLPAVRDDQVWALNGPAYFNRPGPRTIRGVEVVAAVLHGVGEVRPDEANRVEAGLYSD